MRVPVNPPPSNNPSQPKPAACNNNHGNVNSQSRNNFPIGSSYEPTSVLDICRSPSPASQKPPLTADVSGVLPTLAMDEHDWDSIMRDLGLDDDPATGLRAIPQFCSYDTHLQSVPELAQQDSTQPSAAHADFNFSDLLPGHGLSPGNLQYLDGFAGGNVEICSGYIEELVRAADCFDTNELQLAQVILARLNEPLRSPVGKPLQRAAFFFKESLQALLAGSGLASRPGLCSSAEIVQTIRAYKSFCGISPIPMFTLFTTNQAILESLDGSAIHIVDFDIGLGGQYASLLREIAEKFKSIKVNPPILRITAVVPDELAASTRLVRENLTQFADELQIRIQIDFIPFRAFEILLLKAFELNDGERIAILLSPIIFRSRNVNVPAFMNDLRRASPSVLVVVDSEAWMETGATSFRRNLVNGLEFYAMMFESLEAAPGGGGEWGRMIERYLMRPRIISAVEAMAARRAAPPWREVLRGTGMRAVQLSQFADFQAECLLGKVQVRGFHVAKRGSELVLCWRGRVLLATSAWVC